MTYLSDFDRDILLTAAGRRTRWTAPPEEIIAAQDRLIALGLLEQIEWHYEPTELGYNLAQQIAEQTIRIDVEQRAGTPEQIANALSALKTFKVEFE